ncbi:tyrosine-type recombinase/integrase [Stenotrophomonas maltophilia]|nr:tyrosine-type recombinase/integrase [Stenotrophomonas maltophilia]MBH1503317.1 tyrosine-type recombinase/integrase [Stenotrophomonas maltophilia]
MAPRQRSKSRQGWPANLYPNRDGFKYRHPVTKKETWMGTDQARAFAAAKKLNTLLVPTNDLVARVVGGGHTVNDAVDVFERDDMPHRKWGAKNIENARSLINRIRKHIGERNLDSFSVKDCATFIREVTESDRSRQLFRSMLTWVFACAVEEGWIDRNPAEVVRKFQAPRQRERLTADVYKKIHAKAPAWLQLAMDISLMTLLRREDVVNLKFTDYHDGHLWVVPGKTKTTTGVRMKIVVNEELAALLAKARDDVVSPYFVHRLPLKARPSNKRAKARVHHTQLLPEQLSREFQDVRESIGLVGKHQVSFHEIRSLGGALLHNQQGWSEEQVQHLLTHSSPAMTEVYLEGHERPWTEINTGILAIR